MYIAYRLRLTTQATTQWKRILPTFFLSRKEVWILGIVYETHKRSRKKAFVFWYTDTVFVFRWFQSEWCQAKLLKCNTFALFYDWRTAWGSEISTLCHLKIHIATIKHTHTEPCSIHTQYAVQNTNAFWIARWTVKKNHIKRTTQWQKNRTKRAKEKNINRMTHMFCSMPYFRYVTVENECEKRILLSSLFQL